MNQKDQHRESLNLTLNIFKKGHSVPEIAYKRKLAFSTIENHLRKLLEEGKIELHELLDEDKIKLIEAAAENCDSLKEIKERLSEDITYSEIRYELTALGRQKKKTAIEIVINTYIGNYCFRKCFNHDDIITGCSQKFDALRKSMSATNVSFKEFNDMMKNDEIKICKLPLEEKRRYVSWRYFEYLKDRDFWDIKAQG
ncbi:MAG: helix-turn-helix domain-containing protein [archaeon]